MNKNLKPCEIIDLRSNIDLPDKLIPKPEVIVLSDSEEEQIIPQKKDVIDLVTEESEHELEKISNISVLKSSSHMTKQTFENDCSIMTIEVFEKYLELKEEKNVSSLKNGVNFFANLWIRDHIKHRQTCQKQESEIERLKKDSACLAKRILELETNTKTFLKIKRRKNFEETSYN